MVELPKERLQNLLAKIEQQRNTVEALKRDGHVYEDAERQLAQMLAELRATSVRDSDASRSRKRPRTC